MKKLKVNPGVCGMECLICAEKQGRKDVKISVDTKCKAVKAMVEGLDMPLDAYEICFEKSGSGKVYKAAEKLSHAACPVPSAIIKCIEAECALALPRSVTFEFIEE